MYMHQDNSGQLNALANGLKIVDGKYITFLHSDDELLDDQALERNVSVLNNYPSDGVFSDLVKMNNKGDVFGMAKTADSIGRFSPAILFLRGGSNIISDVFFARKDVLDNVLLNYIYWNMPYWLKFTDTRVSALNLKKVKPWYKYRVYPENYVLSEIGKFETANGCLRTVVEIGQRLHIPLLRVQKILTRIFKTRVKPIFRREQSNRKELFEMIKYVVKSYFEKTPENIYFRGLIGFYTNLSSRAIEVNFTSKERIFLGKDARIFYNLMEKRQLPSIYEYVLEEAYRGFGKVIINNKKDYEQTKNMIKFLNLFAEIKVA